MYLFVDCPLLEGNNDIFIIDCFFFVNIFPSPGLFLTAWTSLYRWHHLNLFFNGRIF